MKKLEEVSLILDLGKTNIKFYFINEKTLKSKVFTYTNNIIKKNKEYEINTDYLNELLLKLLKKSSNKYKIKNINFTSHGSVVIGLNSNYEIISKISDENLYSKLIDQLYIEKLQTDYFNYSEKMSRGYNLGKQIFYLNKINKNAYNRIKFFIPLPQYLCFILTNKIFIDKVYLTNHSHLWNFKKNTFSKLAKDSKLNNKIPYFSDILKTYSKVSNKNIINLLNTQQTKVFCGMHDSSACLYFHSNNYKKNFILLSSGTWAVIYFKINYNEMFKNTYQNKTINFNYSNEFTLSLRFPLGKIYSDLKKKNKLIDYNKIDYVISTKIIKENLKNDVSNELEFLKSFNRINKYNDIKLKYYYLFFLFSLKIALSVIEKKDVNTIIVDGVFAKNKVFLFYLNNILKNKILIYKNTDGVAMGAFNVFCKINKNNYKLTEIKKNKKFIKLFSKLLT